MNKLKRVSAESVRMGHAATHGVAGLTGTPTRVPACGGSCLGDGARACRVPD